MKHKRILGYSAIGLTLIAVGVAFIKPISTSNLLFRVRADMSNLSVTFNSSGAQSHTDNYTYYRSANTSLGNTFYLRNRSNINPQSNEVAVMCGNSEKGSIENEIIFTNTNIGTSLFEFRNILSISAVSNSSSTRTLTVFKSSDGTNWSDAGSLAFNSSGGTNTDVSGAKDIKLTYPSAYFTVYITSFTINYSCSDEPGPEKELSSISVSGAKTEFTIGDTFSFGGTVTAHYSDSTSADVTSSATFSGYDMDEEGEQTVTVSYTEDAVVKTTTYNITIAATPSPSATLSSLLTAKSYVVSGKINTYLYELTMDFANNMATARRCLYESGASALADFYTQSFEYFTNDSTITISFTSVGSLTQTGTSAVTFAARLKVNGSVSVAVTNNEITTLDIGLYNSSGTLQGTISLS